MPAEKASQFHSNALSRAFGWQAAVTQMKSVLCGFTLTQSVLMLSLPTALADEGKVDSFSEVVSIVESHCLDCHSSEDQSEAGIDLTSWKDVQQDPELVLKLSKVVDRHRMPPSDANDLSDDDRQVFVAAMGERLRALADSTTSAPVTGIRRMNRFQYNNAVVDLFDLKVTVFTLPEKMMRDHKGYFQPASGTMPDVVDVGSRPLGKSQLIERRLAGVAAFPQDLRAEHGYDNQADHLSLSPLLMESFLKLGRSIVESPDFTPRNVGLWDRFFIPPADVNESEVRRRLTSFLRTAFRRDISGETLDRYSSFVMQRLESGVTFTDAMKAVAAAAISSPRFLYLYSEKESADDLLHSFDLASRLSFFLWGSLPDDRLLGLAQSGKLLSDDVLSAEVERMLKDVRLKRFCDSFPSQWLQLERIISSVPEAELFPDFYFSKYRNSMHMMLEPLLVFETILIENRPINELIHSNFTYRSSRLNDAYKSLGVSQAIGRRRGQGDVQVLGFYRVPVEDRRVGGVMTTAAVMTMTSGTERTQPITRGAWMATVIFNDPPEPPPADVPPLDEKPPADEQHLTLRERLSIHRERADCRGCHEQIDPLGFAFENFNAVGQWRDSYVNGRDIDVSGQLFGRHLFTNVEEFKQALLREEEKFQEAFASHLLSFALARKLTALDHVAVVDLVAEARKDDCRMQSLIRQVVLSKPFRSR